MNIGSALFPSENLIKTRLQNLASERELFLDKKSSTNSTNIRLKNTDHYNAVHPTNIFYILKRAKRQLKTIAKIVLILLIGSQSTVQIGIM
jgi:hypothetical protein